MPSHSLTASVWRPPPSTCDFRAKRLNRNIIDLHPTHTQRTAVVNDDTQKDDNFSHPTKEEAS